MKLTRLSLVAAPLLLLLATGARAEDPMTIKVRVIDGEIAYFHHGKRLRESTLNRFCDTARREKTEIVFQREEDMRSRDVMASLLREADCFGSSHGSLKKAEPEPRSESHKHARRRHRAAERL
jgi:hypothetical protein